METLIKRLTLLFVATATLAACGGGASPDAEIVSASGDELVPGVRRTAAGNGQSAGGESATGPTGGIATVTHHEALSCFYGGDSCSDSSDCCSGSCDNGVCEQRTCDSVNDCALGSSSDGFECTDSGFCVEQCTRDADCRHEDWVCSQGGRCIDATGRASATVAIQADLDELPDARGLGVKYRLPDNSNIRVTDPDGDGIGLSIGDEGDKRRSVLVEGNGSSLVVDGDIVGLRIRRSAAYSEVEDLRIDPAPYLGSNEHSGVGIDVRAHGVRLDNIYVRRMGTGIRAHSRLDLNDDGDADDPFEYSNLNSQQWSKLRFDDCYHNAISLDGQDTNAGTFTGVEVLSGAGIRDDSFLGNVWVGLQAEGTTGHSIEMSQSSQTATVVGAYVELSDPAPTSESLNSLWVSGNALGRLEGKSERVGYQRSRLAFRDDMGLRVNLPGGPNSVLRWKHPTENEEWALMYEDDWAMWMFAYKNSPVSGYVYGWTGDQNPSGPAVQEVE